MEIKFAVKNLFGQLYNVIEQLTDEQYQTPSVSLSGSTIGQHMRHSLEFFSCLVAGEKLGIVNYDNRERDLQLEQSRAKALNVLDLLQREIHTLDASKELTLELSYSFEENNTVQVPSNIGRELVYNIEHAVHHMALIKIGIMEIASNLELPEGFGVASSTIRYQREQEQS